MEIPCILMYKLKNFGQNLGVENGGLTYTRGSRKLNKFFEDNKRMGKTFK